MFSQRNLHKKMSFMSLVSFILTFLVDNRLFKLIVVYILLSEGKPDDGDDDDQHFHIIPVRYLKMLMF